MTTIKRMVLPAVITAVRNAAIVTSAVLTPLGWMSPSSPSSGDSSHSSNKSPSSTVTRSSNMGIGRLFRIETDELNEFSFCTGIWVGSLLGITVGYWTAVQFQRLRVKERFIHFRAQYKKMREDESSEDQNNTQAGLPLEKPTQISKIEGVSIQLAAYDKNEEWDEKNSEANLQLAQKSDVYAVLRHVISPRNSLASTLYSCSIEIQPGAILEIPSTRGVQLFYVLSGSGVFRAAECFGTSNSQSNENHSYKKGSFNWKDMLFFKANCERGERSGSFATKISNISQGDVFVIEPWRLVIFFSILISSRHLHSIVSIFNSACFLAKEWKSSMEE